MFEPFDAATVPLRESNLIEASAGTGKTYSIAILALRLVLEAGLSVRDILMVTFTKAAIAELQERIRHFIRKAWQACDTEIDDQNIQSLVAAAIAERGYDEVKTALRDAVLLMDETSVLTIHSFCQKTLNEFAFETGKAFSATLVTDTKALHEEAINEFWRKRIATLPADVLRILDPAALRELLYKAAKDHFSGKTYYDFDALIAEENAALRKGEEAVRLWEELNSTFLSEQAAIIKRCQETSVLTNNVLDHAGSAAKFYDRVWKESNKAKPVKAVVKEFEEKIAQYDAFQQLVQEARSALVAAALHSAGTQIRRHKSRNSLLTFDDLITDLHGALRNEPNPTLVAALRGKYKAVFVDEFQDTDRQQYEIFQAAFGEHIGDEEEPSDLPPLFYIGDPKQSIYAFRSADVFTYFDARDAVQRRWSMNTNFRSGARLIDAMNQLFQPQAGFDTFHFKDGRPNIEYHPVSAPGNNDKGSCLRAGVAEAPLTVFTAKKKPQIAPAVAAQVAMLLEKENDYRIGRADKCAPVRPSDIGILVRSKSQASDIKAALAALGIPSVTVDDSKVLQSAEATALLYFLQAAHQPDSGRIARALLSPFTGFSSADILALDAEEALRLFTGYGELWARGGVYAAIRAFTTDFSVRQAMASRGSTERALANLTQLTELVHAQSVRRSLSRTDLIEWLRRGIAGMVTEGDAYEQRIESDEDAVNIVTIHKSKGLEYKIVFAPYLDFKLRDKDEFVTFRDPGDGKYYGVEKSRRSTDQTAWLQEQEEQENRRLLYVAITRAVYQLYIVRCESYKNSTLSTFLQALSASPDSSLIAFADALPKMPDGYQYTPGHHDDVPSKTTAKPRPVRFELEGNQWLRMSYTRLAAKAEKPRMPRAQPGEDTSEYDRFAFHDLTRGPKTGDLLHYIFERVLFDKDDRWEAVVDTALTRYAPGKADAWKPMLLQMLGHAVRATLHIGGQGRAFTLSEVTRQRRIAELEFDFPVSPFKVAALQAISGNDAAVRVKEFASENGTLEGLMNGKMDLFFEHGGRYYILDWKSNHLGYAPEAYNGESVAHAMEQDNYHLQYLIYALAAKRFLERRLDGFDYERHFGGVAYLFVRGVRAGSDSGVFTARPGKETIEALESILCGSDGSAQDMARVAQRIAEELAQD